MSVAPEPLESVPLESRPLEPRPLEWVPPGGPALEDPPSSATITSLRRARWWRRWWTAVRAHPVLLRFGSVGAICAVIDNTVAFTLGNTVLVGKRTVAYGVGVLVATIISYVLNREWAFRTSRRTGVDARERVHEAARFFGVCGVALLLSAIPLWWAHTIMGWNDATLGPVWANIVQLTCGTVLGTLIGMAVRWTLFTRFVFVGPAAADLAPEPPDLD